MRVLVNADWTAEMEKAPPMVTKTVMREEKVRQKGLGGGKVRSKLTIYNSADLRQILRSSMNLRISNSDLECSSSGKANEDLIANPLGSRGIDIHGIEESSPYRGYCAPDDPEQRHDANF
jgi:hypothetical protein